MLSGYPNSGMESAHEMSSRMGLSSRMSSRMGLVRVKHEPILRIGGVY